MVVMSGPGRDAPFRSWLFAPGDSAKKMQKALNSGADIILLDLEDSVSEGSKPAARGAVAEFLKENAARRDRLWVRINPLQGPHALADLTSVIPAGPGGVMLPKARGPDDLERLGHYLAALETAAGVEQDFTRVIVVATETPQGLLAAGRYERGARLAALTWGAEDIATALGAFGNREEDGSYEFTYKMARSLCLVGAAAAGVPAIETIHADFHDAAGLAKVAAAARRAGFQGMMAIHPAQIEVINAAFTPTAEEIAEAQEIVELFATRPTAGAIAHRGAMLDLPHLNRAVAILASLARVQSQPP
jgi:citrate lyase subunit beta/citryl-CoA lyase